MISKKCIWLITKIIIWILVIGHAFFIFIDYVMFLETDSFRGIFMERLVNSAVGVPYYQEIRFVNNSPELRPIPAEDWYNAQCGARPPVPYLDLVVSDDELSKISPAKRTQLECLAIRGFSSYSYSDDIEGELCSNYFNCRTFSLGVEDYVLAKPDILWNILKILERPCDYIDTLENIKKKPGYKEKTDKKAQDYEQNSIGNNKRRLGCDGKRKYWWRAKEDYIILNVYRSGNKQPRDFFGIVVKRKDI